MLRARAFWILVPLLAMSCDRGDERSALEGAPTVRGDEDLTGPRPIIVEGCLTASGDRFVLTELDRGMRGPDVVERKGSRPAAEPEPTTESYRLVGFDEKLRPLVGQRVQITGATEPEKVVDVRESSPPRDPKGEQGVGTSGTDPQVSTVQTTRLEVSDLRVESVQTTGDECGEGRR